jgi:hypothetical protein
MVVLSLRDIPPGVGEMTIFGLAHVFYVLFSLYNIFMCYPESMLQFLTFLVIVRNLAIHHIFPYQIYI